VDTHVDIKKKARRREGDRPAADDVGRRRGPDPLAGQQLQDGLADPLVAAAAAGNAVQRKDGGAQSRSEAAGGESRAEAEGGAPPGFDAEEKAAELHEACDGWGTDERVILDILYTGRRDLTKAIEAAYNRRYKPALAEELRDELSGGDLQKALKLLGAGGLTLADKIREAMDGWGTDEDQIFNALDRANASELATIRKDPALIARFEEEFSGADYKLAMAYIDGRGQLAGKLRRAVEGWGTDEQEIWRALEGASREEKDFALAQPALINHLKSDLDAADWLKCERMLRGQLTNVDRIEVALAGWGTDEASLNSALTNLTAAEYSKLPPSIDSRLEDELSGGDLASAQEILHQKRLQFDADYRDSWLERQRSELGEEASRSEGMSALLPEEGGGQSAIGKLKSACAGAGTDDESIWSVLASLSRQEREFIRTYNPDGVLDTLRDDLSEGDYRRALQALGEDATAAKAVMREAIEGWGTSERLLYDALSRAAAERAGQEILNDTSLTLRVAKDVTVRQFQIFVAVLESSTFTPMQRLEWACSGAGTDEDLVFELCQQYSAQWWDGTQIVADVDTLLDAELDTRDYWKAKDAIRPEAQSEQERLERSKEMLERERGSDLSAGIMDLFSHSGENADDAWREYQSSYNQAYEDGQVSDEEATGLRKDEAFSARMTEEYRETKASVAQWATQIAVAIVGIAATILTAGTAGPFVAALAASLGGKVAVAAEAMVLAAVLKVGLNKAIQGEGYDLEGSQALIDACSASIEVGLNVVGGQVATKIVGGLGKTPVLRSVGPSVEKVFGKAGRHILAGGMEGAVDGGLGGLGEGAFLALANEDNWEGDVENLLGNVGQQMTLNGAMSALGGFGAGAAFKSLGEAFGPKLNAKYGDDLAKHADDISGDAALIKNVTGQFDEGASEAIEAELKGILHGALEGSNGPMTGAQFNQLMDELADFAKKYDVTISKKLDTVGVFPKGADEIQLAGFGKASDVDGAVGFAKRHELAHVFHTLQTRATLLDAVKKGRISIEQANTFVEIIEEGANYRQFEKAATGASSAAHRTTRSQDVGLYADRLDDLIGNTRLGLHAGKMKFPTGKTFEEVYALFLSKAPAVVGTGMKDLAIRMPPIMFASLYLANVDVTAYGISPIEWGIDPGGGGNSMGFRDFINKLVTDRG